MSLKTRLEDSRIAIIGLGYVGLPLAVEFGKRYDTIGFDINAARIAELRQGRDSTLEVEPELLAQAARLSYADTLGDIATCNVYIVTVPTPIDTAKRPDLTPLIKASEAIGSILKPGDTVIYESTVYPGCTEEVCVPILERASGLRFEASACPSAVAAADLTATAALPPLPQASPAPDAALPPLPQAGEGRGEGALGDASSGNAAEPGQLSYLQDTARRRGNVFAALVEAVKTHSLGQISHALYDVGGEYRRNM